MKISTFLLTRNNARHLVEYFAWYHVIGVDSFLVYDHMSNDGSYEIIKELSKFYDIRCTRLTGKDAHIQSYNDLLNVQRPSGEFDWIISADNDEIYVPMDHDNIKDFLEGYMDKRLSCLGIYWLMYGNNGHIEWEPGLVTECYTRRAPLKHRLNHHIKPILRGGAAGGRYWGRNEGHCLHTEYGTFDVDGRLIRQGLNYPAEITHDKLRINHYYSKSWAYFKEVKQPNNAGSGAPQQDGHTSVGIAIPDSFWHEQNFNDEEDASAWEKFGEKLKIQYNIMKNQIGL